MTARYALDDSAVHQPKGAGFCYTCGLHVDARIHHTPERLAGTAGPPIGATMLQDPIEQGAILIATTMRPDGGFGRLQGIAGQALRDLVASGWTPPAREGDDESSKLRSELEAAYRQIDHLQLNVSRLDTDLCAAQAVRDVLVGAAYTNSTRIARADDAGAARLLEDRAEKRHSDEDVDELLLKVLRAGDKAAGRVREQRAKQDSDWEALTGEARNALAVGHTEIEGV